MPTALHPTCAAQITTIHITGGDQRIAFDHRDELHPVGPGVYVIAVGGEAQYMGETENLTVRFNNGYGTISPRSCFTGGQSTNCRINTFILAETQQGKAVELWFSP